ncbi:hypothetical protein E4U10_002222 [Claviceps purpurea]|nr:hypothetical protein E4U10_002222 [Claviceps purpurea]
MRNYSYQICEKAEGRSRAKHFSALAGFRSVCTLASAFSGGQLAPDAGRSEQRATANATTV